MKFLHFTIQDWPWLVNLDHVQYIRYKRENFSKNNHRIIYRLTGATEDRICFYADDADTTMRIYKRILDFVSGKWSELNCLHIPEYGSPEPESTEPRRTLEV